MIPPRRVLRALLLGALGTGWTGPAAAQSLRGDRAGFGGFELRRFTFASGFAAKSVRQAALPFGGVVPFGRFTLDIGGTYASTTLVRADGSERTVSAFTDTQVRGSYTIGRDLVVATVLLNLPTGLSRAPAQDFTVLGAVSSSFLAFPVNSYGNGFSLTSGLAVAVPAGDWNVGAAGSVRANAEYTPYVDANGPFTYAPGLEGRVRLGADRLVGASRVTLGLTYSTFGTDEFASGTTTAGLYRPGPRWIAEAGVTAPIGAGSFSLFAWNYHRASGDSTGGAVGNQENLLSLGAFATVPAAPGVSLELSAEGRLSNPDQGKGRLGEGGAGLRVILGPRVVFTPTVRYTAGSLTTGSGNRHNLRGFYLAGFIRGSF